MYFRANLDHITAPEIHHGSVHQRQWLDYGLLGFPLAYFGRSSARVVLALFCVSLLSGCVYGDPAVPEPGVRRTPAGGIVMLVPKCELDLHAVTLRTSDGKTPGAVVWSAKGPTGAGVLGGEFVLGDDSAFTVVNQRIEAALPSRFEVDVHFGNADNGDRAVVVDTSTLPAEAPPPDSYWQWRTGKGFVARTVKEIRDGTCSASR